MNKYNCNFCNNTFSSKGILETHQKKAKYCLEIQGITPSKKHICNICKKELSTKLSLERHINTHTSNEIQSIEKNTNLENQLVLKEDTISDLKQQIKALKNFKEDTIKNLNQQIVDLKQVKDIENMFDRITCYDHYGSIICMFFENENNITLKTLDVGNILINDYEKIRKKYYLPYGHTEIVDFSYNLN